MRITLNVNASSATLMAALREAQRQKEAMDRHYDAMRERGDITGREAEKRLFAQSVILQALADLVRAVADEERATEAFGPRGADE